MDKAKRLPASAGRANRRRRGGAVVLAAMLLGMASAGCIRGSLATSTGPNGPTLWSADNKQEAHVGETVRYSFILINPVQKRPLDPYGYADYCIAEVGGRRIACEPDLQGHFRFEHRLTDVQPGDELEVTATAYRQYGARDFLPVGDTWLRGESPVDEPDREVCDDSITLHLYQARVALEIRAEVSSLDLESGKLELFHDDAAVTSVFIDRPGRPGFVATQRGRDGVYSITYEPDGDELNPSGQTRARFTVYDLAGHPHSAQGMIPTP